VLVLKRLQLFATAASSLGCCNRGGALLVTYAGVLPGQVAADGESAVAAVTSMHSWHGATAAATIATLQEHSKFVDPLGQ
jgi:hypothetical protein